jgi:endonuclease/exonuclease/phosphatase family metal-dependent hydrolase
LPYVTWSSVAVTGAKIEQANDSAFTSGVRTYSINGSGRRYTPYLVSKGHLYYFRVRANNNGTLSGWSAATSTLVLNSVQSTTVMTYNVLTNAADGTTQGGNKVAPWTTSRRNAVAALIKGAAPDLVSIQEASGWVGSPQGFGGTRMVDDLVRALGGMYGLARTETPPTEHGYLRTGDYILYKKSTYAPVGTGGYFTIGTYNGASKYAPYQILRSVASGAQVLFVATHTSNGAGSASDTARGDQTKSMLSQTNTYNANHGNLPVIYAGDFNSHPAAGHVDGPGDAMAAAGIPDALDVAQARTNANYNSANQYMNPPPATADNIDHIYVPVGTGVYSWTLVIHLVNGRFSGVIPSDHNALMTHVALPY